MKHNIEITLIPNNQYHKLNRTLLQQLAPTSTIFLNLAITQTKFITITIDNLSIPDDNYTPPYFTTNIQSITLINNLPPIGKFSNNSISFSNKNPPYNVIESITNLLISNIKQIYIP